MSRTESDFKYEFKKDIIKFYPELMMWSVADAVTAHLPDIAICYNGSFHGLEAKYIKELPKRVTSKCLKHEVTEGQVNSLEKIKKSRNKGYVIIGIGANTCVITDIIKTNYTLDELKSFRRYLKVNGVWQLGGILDWA